MTRVEVDQKVAQFMAELLDLCRRHGISIGHEDEHGRFELHPYSDDYASWLEYADRQPLLRALQSKPE